MRFKRCIKDGYQPLLAQQLDKQRSGLRLQAIVYGKAWMKNNRYLSRNFKVSQ
jgi:hypothetical protein